MTLDYKKMFLIVTEEAVVKGHFTIYLVFGSTRGGCIFYWPDLSRGKRKMGSQKAAQHEYHTIFCLFRQWPFVFLLCKSVFYTKTICVFYTLLRLVFFVLL